MPEEVELYVQQALEEVGKWPVPGYTFPAILIIGLFFVMVGAKICKGVIAGLCFVAGGAAGYHLSGDNVLIAAASGVGAAVIGLVVQYIVGVVLSGLAVAATAFVAAHLAGHEELAPYFAIGGFLVGAILSVRLYKILLIFATSALGAACVAPCALILLDATQRPEMTAEVPLGTLQLDTCKFSVTFLGVLAAGVIVQGISLALKKAPKATEE